MTAISYTDWASLSGEDQKARPGISVERTHSVNNPDRGAYWSPATAAGALGRHVQEVLTGDDELAKVKMWNGLKQLHRSGTESPRMIDRAMQGRQDDAFSALGAYNGDLNEQALEQLTSVFDDVAKLQEEAQILGVDPVDASRRMLSRAAGRAVGYEMNDAAIEAEMRPLIESPTGSSIIANMNQSVAQLSLVMRDMPIDALDDIATIGRDGSMTEELRDEHRRLTDVLKSIPLILNPQDIEPERNFSVRMESKEEATMMETIVKWAGEHDKMPEEREIHRAFASWRDNGLSPSPHSVDREQALGIVLGNTDNARENVQDLIAGLDEQSTAARNAPVVVLTVDADQRMRDALAATGRPVVDVTAEADAKGVYLSSDGKDLPANRVELLNLSREQAADPVERSLAANALVGRSHGVGYIPGNRMNAVEAQAVHIAGTLRKLNLVMNQDGTQVDQKELPKVRAQAREMDAEVDPQRYYTAGHARPLMGVNSVAFEAANKYDMANKANAPDRDLIAEAYAAIPAKSTILTVDNKDNAAVKWMMEKSNTKGRNVLYADASRTMSYAEMTDVSLDGEKKRARDASASLRIYAVPENKRQWETMTKDNYYREARAEREKYEFENRTNPNKQYIPRETRETGDPETISVMRTPMVEWDSPKIRGAIVLVTGHASKGAINAESQAIKIAQEKVMDQAASALILTDDSPRRQTTDIHSAKMIDLAVEMGKMATVRDGTGAEIRTLEEAHRRTMHLSENFSEKIVRETEDMMTIRPDDDGKKRRFGDRRNAGVDVAAKDDLGQLALAALPGMSALHAVQFAQSDVTLKEIRNDKSEEMRKGLMQLGMPAETRAIINDIAPWTKAMDRAQANLRAGVDMGAQLHVPSDVTHPVEVAGGKIGKVAVFTIGEFDYAKQPVAALVGNSQRFREAGAAMTLSQAEKAGPQAERGAMVDPADALDRTVLRRSIEQLTAKGYGIGVTFEEGVSRAVLEEAAKVPDAKLVVVAPGNIQAASPALRAALKPLLQEDRASVIMPVNIAPHQAPEPKNGEERKPDTYMEDRATMQSMLARTAKVALVVAASDKDQSLHIVRQMVDQGKPVAAVVPQDMKAAGSELYAGNLKLLRGAGRTHIESISYAQATSANAYAEISDKETAVVMENGVRRGNAGTFSSAKLGKSPMARSGHHYREMGWGAAAHPVHTAASIDSFVEKAERGEGALGQFQAPTERELERIRTAKHEAAMERTDSRAAAFAREQFGQTSALHRGAIERDAGYRIEMMGLDEKVFEKREIETQAARQAAAAGQSMN